jgi:hypothetical protein
VDQVIRRSPGCGSRAVPGGGRSHAPPPGSSKARTDVARFRRPRTRTGCLSASRGAFVQHITVDRVQGTRFVQVHDPLVACLCAGPRGWSSRLRIGDRSLTVTNTWPPARSFVTTARNAAEECVAGPSPHGRREGASAHSWVRTGRVYGGTCSSAPWRTPARHPSGWRRRQRDVCRVPALSVQDTLPRKLSMSSPAGRVITMAT